MVINKKCSKCNKAEHMGPCNGLKGAGEVEDDTSKQNEDQQKLKMQQPTAALSSHAYIVHELSTNDINFLAQFQKLRVEEVSAQFSKEIKHKSETGNPLETAENIARLVLGVKNGSALEISYHPELRNEGFQPTPPELGTYLTFQKQTGISIKIDGKDISNEQFTKLKINGDFMNEIDKATSMTQPTADQSSTSKLAPTPFSMAPSPASFGQ